MPPAATKRKPVVVAAVPVPPPVSSHPDTTTTSDRPVGPCSDPFPVFSHDEMLVMKQAAQQLRAMQRLQQLQLQLQLLGSNPSSCSCCPPQASEVAPNSAFQDVRMAQQQRHPQPPQPPRGHPLSTEALPFPRVRRQSPTTTLRVSDAPATKPEAEEEKESSSQDPILAQRLSAFERDYVQTSMKRKDCMDVVRLLHDDEALKQKKQCGDKDVPLRIQVLQSHLPPKVRMQIFDDLRSGVSEKYVQWVRRAIRLPIGVTHESSRLGKEDEGESTQTSLQEVLAHTLARMDAQVTGQCELKREVLKLVCQQHLAKQQKGQPGGGGGGGEGTGYPLGLEGPPGTGKTHFVRNALAPALGKPVVCIPLGGATDISYLLGHIYTYEGSKEGRLAGALLETQCCDPVIFFDEVDKISTTERGQELAAVLLHLVDPTSNNALRDRYFHDIDLDFSKCTFVFGYNDASRISPILLDRIKRLRVPCPTPEERERIVRDHFVPRTQQRLNASSLHLSDAALAVLLDHASRGGTTTKGMRTVEHFVHHVLSTAQLCLACGKDLAASSALAGFPSVGEDGNVSAAFADAVLTELVASGATNENTPPIGMYS